MATILLGLAYIERTLSALFYAAGRDDLKRASFSKLLDEAHIHGLVGNAELRNLERIREKRNAYAHFRKPGHQEGIDFRSIAENDAPYKIIERDATDVVEAVLQMLDKGSI